MKEKILIATLELASEKGLGFVSMSQIASKCGLSKSSLYSHYKSKDEIISKMYEYFRKEALTKESGDIDINTLFDGKNLYEFLSIVVKSYKNMNTDKYLSMFYKMVYQERTINKEAAQILITETNKMIEATKNLFILANKKGIANFNNVDVCAMSFALSVNQIMNYELDLEFVGKNSNNYLDSYIKEFSNVYGG